VAILAGIPTIELTTLIAAIAPPESPPPLLELSGDVVEVEVGDVAKVVN